MKSMATYFRDAQLLLVHYHYYYSAATLLSCHLSEALASMRTAIEAGLTAYRIIEDRPSQLAERRRRRLVHGRNQGLRDRPEARRVCLFLPPEYDPGLQTGG